MWFHPFDTQKLTSFAISLPSTTFNLTRPFQRAVCLVQPSLYHTCSCLLWSTVVSYCYYIHVHLNNRQLPHPPHPIIILRLFNTFQTLSFISFVHKHIHRSRLSVKLENLSPWPLAEKAQDSHCHYYYDHPQYYNTTPIHHYYYYYHYYDHPQYYCTTTIHHDWLSLLLLWLPLLLLRLPLLLWLPLLVSFFDSKTK